MGTVHQFQSMTAYFITAPLMMAVGRETNKPFSQDILEDDLRIENSSMFHTFEIMMKMLFMVSYGDVSSTRATYVVCSIFIMILGFVLHLIILLQIMRLWYNFFSTENQQTTVYDSIGAFMRYKALPIPMRERIWLYLDFKYQEHFYKDSIIRKITSQSLRREIILKASIDSTEKVDLFQTLPENVKERLRACMVSEIYLPDDVIIRAGQTGTCMFFILAGTVRITSPDNHIICYLRDGTHFGEVALLINIARVANVVAETPCELLRLSRHYFLEVVQKYPYLMQEMKIMAGQRMTSNSLTPEFEAETIKVDIDADPIDKEFEIIGEVSDQQQPPEETL